jgi:ADP-ribose pyrophosphatase
MTLAGERPYKTLSSRYLWQSRWYNVRQDRLHSSNAGEFTYTVIEKPVAVWIVPATSHGTLVLIDQYRYPVDDWCLEVPAGNVEPGIDPALMAARELREEIGGSADRMVQVADFYTMNGIGNEIALVFLALGVSLGEPSREPTEYITLREVLVEEALHLAHTGQIKDGPSALALLLSETGLRQYLKEKP